MFVSICAHCRCSTAAAHELQAKFRGVLGQTHFFNQGFELVSHQVIRSGFVEAAVALLVGGERREQEVTLVAGHLLQAGFVREDYIYWI